LSLRISGVKNTAKSGSKKLKIEPPTGIILTIPQPKNPSTRLVLSGDKSDDEVDGGPPPEGTGIRFRYVCTAVS
jgi:hypothetical protein